MLSVNTASTGARARCLAPRPCVRFNGLMDLNRMPSSTHGHDFHNGLSRVVMVRKTEQRTFASNKNGEEPKFERVTRETVQTFSGSRSQKSTSEKRDIFKKLPQELAESLDEADGGEAGESARAAAMPESAKPTGKKAADSTSESADRFAQECLQAHNTYRAKHNVPALKLSKKLCKYSEEWAKHLASRGQMEHRPNSEYGENIFCIWSSDPNYSMTGREPVDNWYNEIKNHAFGKEPRDLKSGHFSQVVWRDSKELGVATSKSRNGQIFVVANYDPPGNFIGSFTNNVPPVGGFLHLKTVPKPMPSDVALAQSDRGLQEEALRVHNDYRKKHGAPPLELDLEMCTFAAEWAHTLAREDRFAHRSNNPYGENIFCHWSSDSESMSKVTAKDACDAWYNEIKDHEFNREPRTLKSGHFTQLIWKDSKKLGIGIGRSNNGRVLIVANYDPRGNIIGSFSANVPPPVGYSGGSARGTSRPNIES